MGDAGDNPKVFWATAVPSLLYLAVAFACLVQWDVNKLWSRIDAFSGCYLGLRLMGILHSLAFGRGAFRSKQLRREWWGTTAFPGEIKYVVLLMLGDLTVFFDYGHWHLVPALQHPAVQVLGLVVYIGVSAWQIWADTYLAGHFAQPLPAPMSQGPFRYVRHPRYVGAMVGKVAFALVFASILGWPLALAWVLLLLHKIRLEEMHLRRLFGVEYEAYVRSTARLIPGIY